MPRRRRKLLPDQRPDWRDPDMPVIRDYVMRDGTRKTTVDPDYEHRYREFLIETAPADRFPDWRNDPTYNMRRKHND